MAEQTEDVLELEDEVTEGEELEVTETEDEATEEEPEEIEIGFEGFDGAAPAPESESSVIRELRERNRELTAKLKQAETGKAQEQVEVGPKPTLESCDYDEVKFEAALDTWKERKAKAERFEQERKQQREAEETQWAERQKAYEADKASLNLPDFDDAEMAVADKLPEAHRALLLKSGKGAALVAALYRSPKALDDLSKLDPADAAMMIGELRAKLKMTKRERPNPDRPVKGNAASNSADKELTRLEAEAARTGDRTKLVRYKKQLRKQA